MARVADENRRQSVARPPWVRQRSQGHEPILAAFMLGLVIVGVAALLLSGQLMQLIAPRGQLLSASPSAADRPPEGAAAWTVSRGETVVVTLDPPAMASAVPVTAAAAAAVPEVTEPAPGIVPDVATAAAPAVAMAATPAPTARPAATSAPAATPAVTATPAAPGNLALGAARRARVVNTGGRGVVLYSAPRQGGRQPAGLLEGTTVSVLETSGSEWVRVQADARQTGWVRAEYLAPAN